jgi:hypothetical protein
MQWKKLVLRCDVASEGGTKTVWEVTNRYDPTHSN